MADVESFKIGLSKNIQLVNQLKDFQKNPKSLVFVSLAESYRAEGLFVQALEILEEGLMHHPQLASALVAKARCLNETRRYGEALQQLKVVLRNNPQNIKAHKLQAEIYVRLGQRKAAIRALTNVVSLFPQDMESVRALEELENLENKELIPVRNIFVASSDQAPLKPPGRIEDFQVSGIDASLASIGAVASETDSGPQIDIQDEDYAAPMEAPNDDEAEPTFATRTIAELYLRQGLKSKAVRVLRKILRDDAANHWARETLQDLESDGIVLPSSKAAASVSASPQSVREKKARKLERLLARARIMKRIGA